MNVPLQDSMGLRIYRELMHRENRCAAVWHHNYGPEALRRRPAVDDQPGQVQQVRDVPMPWTCRCASSAASGRISPRRSPRANVRLSQGVGRARLADVCRAVGAMRGIRGRSKTRARPRRTSRTTPPKPAGTGRSGMSTESSTCAGHGPAHVNREVLGEDRQVERERSGVCSVHTGCRRGVHGRWVYNGLPSFL